MPTRDLKAIDSIAASGRPRFRARLRRAWSGLSDLILPPVCLSCREPMTAHNTLCGGCWMQVDFIRPPLCDRLGLPLPFATGEISLSAAAMAAPPVYDRARAVAHYSGLMRRLVHDLKFHDRDDLTVLLGGWLTETGKDLLAEADLIVPVPLSRSRLLHRRFNQAARLGGEISARTGIAMDPLSLVRVRATASQVGLSRSEREQNVRGAFAVREARRDRIDGRRIVLVDDVITTGATVAAATRALRRAGAERVDVLALAMATGEGHAD
ncbi:MAG: phosphoribosyltransferase [Hyphomicrobium sp. 32-62-53]|nr:MAG: phosphoribosyltransferase [Hyphomicrobium sp. 12-62-95]OYY00411.1 MAG: phosphoribosyltransferase [Hyphomicrobium sp. 32-62-53]